MENIQVVYFVPEEFDNQRRKDGVDFSCPSGHKNHYIKTEADRLREKLTEMERRFAASESSYEQALSRIEVLNRQISSLRGVITKLRKRGAK